MASATALPSVGSYHLSHDTSTPPAELTDENAVRHWISLIRTNLATADVIKTANGDENARVPLVDEDIMNAPRRKSGRDSLAQAIAAELYPALKGSLGAIIQYEKDIVLLRSLVTTQRRNAIVKATERNERSNWVRRITKQGPWNEKSDPLPLAGAPSLPMPVEQSDKDSLAQFLDHLREGGTHKPDPTSKGIVGSEPYYATELLEFEKGVLYSDGRVDLCKMVTGPRNIGDLMESLKPNAFSRHFLLGNNIIGPTGAKAIAAFIDEFPERFETWYLAGNCIDGPSFKLLVDAMVTSPVITNVWLKRNPLGPASVSDVFRLISQSPVLRTLDLDQTELGDAAIAELFCLLSEHVSAKPLPLRNIYLNACGVGEQACIQISRFLQSPHCSIQSIYMSDNPMGSAAINLAPGLEKNTTLLRLSVQSCGLKDDAIIAIANALHGNTTLTALDIGQNYATEDLGMRFNWITDASAPSLVTLIQSTQLQYLNILYTPMSQATLNTIITAITCSSSILYFFAKPLVTGGTDWASVKAGQENARLRGLLKERLHENVMNKYGVGYDEFDARFKRFLSSPDDVRFIDSVYRNRDSGLARRGLKILDKWWDEGDDTLERVQDGTLGQQE